MCAICTLLDELSEEQREAIRGTVWGSVLEYKKFAMDRFLVQALIQLWNPDRSTFMIGGREVQFSHYDVALVTGLPATGRRWCSLGVIVEGRLSSLSWLLWRRGWTRKSKSIEVIAQRGTYIETMLLLLLRCAGSTIVGIVFPCLGSCFRCW